MTVKKSAKKRGNPLERVARKALRYLSAMKLARSQGDDGLPAIPDLERVEDGLVKASTDAGLRAAITAALTLIHLPETAKVNRTLH